MTARTERRSRTAEQWFWPALIVISVVGAAGWLAYALAVDVPRLDFSDARNFHLLANGLADGFGYVRPVDRVNFGLLVNTAEYPPLFPAVLALGSLVGLDSFTAHQALAALVASTSVPLVGLLGRRVAGPAVGLLAALIALFHPMLFQTGAALMSEAIYLPLVVGVLLAVLRARDEASWRWWALAGGLAGLAALARGEGLILGLIVAGVAVADHVRTDPRRAGRFAGAVVAGVLVVVLPWSIQRSFATGGPVLVSANQQTVLAGANCPATYDGGFRGWWVFSCFAEAGRPGDTEAERYRELTPTAIDFALERPARLPGVAAVRMARVWGLYDTGQQIDWEATEGRVARVQWAGWAYTLLLLPFAAGGAAWLRRRGGPWGLLTAMLVMVTVTAALTYGNQRFRIAAEPALAVLAAVGAMALVSWWSARRRGDHRPVSDPDEAPTESRAPRNDRLEGLRAVAALSVMGTHLGFASGLTFRSHFGAYFARMDIGVAIFFVLSGYLLYRPFIRADLEGRRSPHLGAYFWRRTLRIVPAYWVALAAIPIVLGIDKIRTFGDLVIYGGFLQIYDQGRALGGITQAWSLCTELSFYLALPAYAWLLRRYGRGRISWHLTGLAGLYLVSVLFRTWLYAAEPSVATIAWAWLPANADLFALGMVVALIETGAVQHRGLATTRDTVRRYGRWSIPAAVFVFWVVATRIGLPRAFEDTTTAQELGRQFLYGLVGVLAVGPLALGATRDRIGAVLGWRPIVWMGTISYAFYVWHLDVIGAAVGWLGESIGAASMVDLVSVVFPIAVVISALSWYLVERPLLRFRDLIGPRARRAPRPTEPPAAVDTEDEVVAPVGGVPW